MEKGEVLASLWNYVNDHIEGAAAIDEESFSRSTITKILNMDSLDLVRFVILLEKEFNVELRDEDVINVVNFEDLANAICSASPLNAAID